MLRRFLSLLYDAIRSHKIIDDIDRALKAGDFVLCGNANYKKLFGDASDSTSTSDSCCRRKASSAKTARLRIKVDYRQC